MTMPGCGGAIGTLLAFEFGVQMVVLDGDLGSADCLKVRVGKPLYKKRIPVQLLQTAIFLDGQHDQTFAVILGDDEGTF